MVKFPIDGFNSILPMSPFSDVADGDSLPPLGNSHAVGRREGRKEDDQVGNKESRKALSIYCILLNLSRKCSRVKC